MRAPEDASEAPEGRARREAGYVWKAGAAHSGLIAAGAILPL